MLSRRGDGDVDPVAGGSALLFWAKIAGNAGFFIAVLILARGLGPSGRGTIAFVTVTALVAARSAGLGIMEATSVFVARRPDARGVLFANVLTFAGGSALLAAVVACGALLALDDAPAGLGRAEIAAIAAATVVFALGDAGHSVVLGCGRFGRVAIVTATASWVYPGFLLLLSGTVGLTVTRAVLAWIAAESVRTIAYLGQAARGTALTRPNPSLLAEAIRFGSRAWIGSLARFLNFRVDQLLLGFLASEAVLGVYAVAVNASEVLLYVPAATATALLPIAARTDAERRAEQALRAFRGAALVTATGALLAAFVGPLLLPVVFGAVFDPSVAPFLWLLPGALGFAAIAVFSNALVAASSPGLSSLGPLVALGVGGCLDLALIPRYGASGAAAAASAAFLAGGCATLLAFRRRTPFAWRALVQPRRADLSMFRALARPLGAARPS